MPAPPVARKLLQVPREGGGTIDSVLDNFLYQVTDGPKVVAVGYAPELEGRECKTRVSAKGTRKAEGREAAAKRTANRSLQTEKQKKKKIFFFHEGLARGTPPQLKESQSGSGLATKLVTLDDKGTQRGPVAKEKPCTKTAHSHAPVTIAVKVCGGSEPP